MRILLLDFKPSGGVEPDVVENITGLSAAILSEDDRLEVLAGPDLRAMIDLQAQQDELACGGDNAQSCIAGIADALAAKYVVVGNVGYLGSALNLNLVLFEQQSGRNVGRRAVQAQDLSELSKALRAPLQGLVDDALGAREVRDSGLPLGLALVVGGGVGLGLGAVALAASALPGVAIAGEEQQYRDGDASALTRAKALQHDWFDSHAATGLAVAGGVLVLAGAGVLAAGLMLGVE